MVAVLLAMATTALAAPQRVFVASYGVDTNPCTLVKPCRTFATAVLVVATGGEVIPLDSAEYGPVLIGRSMSIVAPPGVVASVTATESTAVDIYQFGGPGLNVRLKGLRVRGPPNARAIYINGYVDSSLTIEDSDVSSSNSIYDALFIQYAGSVVIRDSAFHDSATGILSNSRGVYERVHLWGNLVGGKFKAPSTMVGLVVEGNVNEGAVVGNLEEPAVVSGVPASITDSVFVGNGVGLRLELRDQFHFNGDEIQCRGPAVSEAGIIRSVVSGNAGAGVVVSHDRCDASSLFSVTLDGNVINDNGTHGVEVTGFPVSGPPVPSLGPAPQMVVVGNTIFGNGATGISAPATSVLRTRGNNAIVQSVPIIGTLTPLPAY